MQSGKNAMESMKESAANVAASAKSGMDKTQATVQEKVDRMTAPHPAAKEMATEKKEQKIRQAELEKQEAREHNARTKETYVTGAGPHQGYRAVGTGTYSTTGAQGHPSGADQMSALPGHGTGQPTGHVTGAQGHPTGAYQTSALPGHGTGQPTGHVTGAQGHPTGAYQTSALPGHGTGQPTGHMTEGVVGSHPVGLNTGTQRTSAAHNPNVEGGAGAQGYGTGGYTG